MNPAEGVPVLEDLGDLTGRRVLVRCDFNVPVQDGQITDDLRIRAALPTLKFLQERGAQVTTCTHFGRPKGLPDPKYSVEPIRARLKELAPEVDLLENLRFDAGEEGNDPHFVDKLIDGFDAYVNDAFGASHRAHASIVGPPRFLPSAAGRLLAKEIDVLGGLLDKPRRPFVVVMGGAKVSDKLGVLDVMVEKADKVLIGGAMAFNFWAAQGVAIDNPFIEPDFFDQCMKLLAGGKVVVAHDFRTERGGQLLEVGPEQVSEYGGRDIGPRTAMDFADAVEEASTVLWNGPMGVFEDPMFEAGTRAVADAMANNERAFTVIGGGDSAAAVAHFKQEKYIDHISTGGGASLELIEQGDLPGLKALRHSQLSGGVHPHA